MNEEIETLEGFNIPKRELTEEEANRDITLERFQNYLVSVGEDFVDQHSQTNLFCKMFLGWMLGKYSESKKDIMELAITDPDMLEIEHFYEEFLDDETSEKFYADFAEFLNFTENSKKRVNQILIQIEEKYEI